MTIEDLQIICNELNGVTSDIKWEDHLCFNIGNKMFLITSPDKVPPSASFKVSDATFNELIETDKFTPAQYLSRYKWVYIDDISLLTQKEWRHYIGESYGLVAAKLPKKLQKEIGLI